MSKNEEKLIPELRFPTFQSEWVENVLGKLMTFKNGINAEKAQYGQGRKFINVLDIITNGPIYHERIIGYVDVSDKEFEKNEVVYGDILFQRSSETWIDAGQSNIFLDKENTATFGGFVIRGRPTVDFDPIYFDLLLKTPHVRKEITTKSGGSTRFNVGQESLASVKIVITNNLKEQQKIAECFNAVDNKLNNLRRKRELLENYKRGVMQQLFSQQLRFKQGDGSNFPDWHEISLNELLTERKEFSTKGKGLSHISLTKAGVVPKTDRYNRDFLVSDDNAKKYKVTRLGDLCYNPANLKFGVISLNTLGDGIFSPIYITFEVKNINRKFLFWLIYQPYFLGTVRRYEQGTVYERQAVSAEDFLRAKVMIPRSREEQQKIADFLLSVDKKIDAVAMQIIQLDTFKKSLLQKLFV